VLRGKGNGSLLLFISVFYTGAVSISSKYLLNYRHVAEWNPLQIQVRKSGTAGIRTRDSWICGKDL
jgi:hypothetical protein